MKRILTFALVAMVALSASAANKKTASKDANKPVFTTIKEIPITSIKDQNRSGTCWDYSTLSYFEAEILKATGKTYDLCESFVANKTYMDRAIQVVRLHGDCQFAQCLRRVLLLEELRHLSRGRHALPRQSLWRLTQQLQRILQPAQSLCRCSGEEQGQQTFQPVEARPAGHPRRLSRRMPQGVQV